MKVEIKIYKIKSEKSKIKAMVGLSFDKAFVVTGLKIIDGSKGLFVAFPSYQTSDGTYKDIAYPLSKEYRENLCNAIIEKYKKESEFTPFE